MAIIAVTGVGGIVRQTVPLGGLFPGHASVDTAPTIVNGVIEHTPEVPSANMHVSAAVVNVKGTGYVVGEILTVLLGTAVTPSTLEVLTIGAGDRVETVKVLTGGEYSVPPANPAGTSSSAVGINATFDLTFAPLGTGGFLNLAQFLDRNIRGGASDKKLVVFWLKILVGTGVAWSLYVTSGHADGLGTEVDNVDSDVVVAAGAGNTLTELNIELAPDESLRLITAAVTSPRGIFQVHFLPAKNASGRPFH